MAVVTMRQLLESGVHFGHQTRRWNPKMKRFIMTERNGIYIIDLQQSLAYIDRAYAFIKDSVSRGGTVMFVGTKKQAQGSIAEQATRVGDALRQPALARRDAHQLPDRAPADQPAQGARRARLRRRGRLRAHEEGAPADEAGARQARQDPGRHPGHDPHPGAIWVVDTKKEHLAVEEARKLHIPIIGILDTNCDPDEVDFPIPGNDDAIRAVSLLTRVVADAVADGLMARAGARAGESRDRRRARRRGADGGVGARAARRPGRGGSRGRHGRRRGAAETVPAAEATGATSEAAEQRTTRRPRPPPRRPPRRRRAPAETPAETRRDGGRDRGGRGPGGRGEAGRPA